MSTLELFLIAVGLSMDAFAVSVTNGLCAKNIKAGWTFAIGLTFGLFQGLMPIIGFMLGQTFTNYITRFDHIIALVLLGFIGGKMLYDALIKKDEDAGAVKITLGMLMLQGIATSIDALAVGVSFSAMKVNIITSAVFICATTFALSVIGVLVGKKFGDRLNKKAEIVGGLILVGIGLKIFIEHTFFGG